MEARRPCWEAAQPIGEKEGRGFLPAACEKQGVLQQRWNSRSNPLPRLGWTPNRPPKP